MDLEGEKLEGAYCVPLHAVFNGPCSEDNVGQRDGAFYNIVAVGEKINSEYLNSLKLLLIDDNFH